MLKLIDYNMGNLGSVANALEHLGVACQPVTDGEGLRDAEVCILPGVGSFGDGMKNLAERGFTEAIPRFLAGGGWLFGVCLGMQMLLESSEEAPGVKGLGIIPGTVVKFDSALGKVPQIGWNRAEFTPGCPLGNGLPENPYFYFVHSYYVPAGKPETVATGTYLGTPFSAAVGAGRCFATQFHPEKSQRCGLVLLRNFLTAAGAF